MLVITGLGAPLLACSIPVFRYALENWQPDAYTAYVLHRGDLSQDQLVLLKSLQTDSLEGSTSANLVVKTLNLDVEPSEQTAELLEAVSGDDLPQIVVRSPGRGRLAETVLTGKLDAQTTAQLLTSPLRQTISERLVKGHSVVWVYLECGRQDEDDKAYAMLEEELLRLQDEIDLPEIEEEDLKDLAADPDALKIQFSAVRLRRDDAQETAFREMLLHVESDLRDEPYINQPMAFPVFGRGRALYALVGDGLAPDLIEEACRFLTGACQCTVKAENPGVDIVMQIEWDRFIKPTEAVDAELPPLAGFSGFGSQSGEVAAHAEASVTPNDDVAGKADSPKVAVAAVDQNGSGDAPSSIPAEPDPMNPSQTEPAGVDGASPGAIWTNTMYVLLSAGCVVTLATLFLLRRSVG